MFFLVQSVAKFLVFVAMKKIRVLYTSSVNSPKGPGLCCVDRFRMNTEGITQMSPCYMTSLCHVLPALWWLCGILRGRRSSPHAEAALPFCGICEEVEPSLESKVLL